MSRFTFGEFELSPTGPETGSCLRGRQRRRCGPWQWPAAGHFSPRSRIDGKRRAGLFFDIKKPLQTRSWNELIRNCRNWATRPRRAAAKKVFVKTLWVPDATSTISQRMTDALAADGYGATDRIEDADLILLNTCHIREKGGRKGLFRARPIGRPAQGRARSVGARDADRRGRLRRAGRGARRSSGVRRPSIW